MFLRQAPAERAPLSASASDTDAARACSRPEMVRLLSRISSIKIRGGIYVGTEDAYIMDVRLVAGPQQELSGQRTSLKTQAIHNDL
jgi:hypothetical protein